MAVTKEIQEEIRRLRQEEGLTSREVSEKLGISKTSVVKYGGSSDTRSLPKEKQDEIFRLRQKEHLSIPEISERVGVSSKVVSKYGGPAITEKKRKSSLQQQQIEASKKHSDKEIADALGVSEKNLTPNDRDRYRKRLHNAKVNPYNVQLRQLRDFIAKSYPEESEQILKTSKGGNKSLTQVLYHPTIRRDFGDLIDRAIENGMDIASPAKEQSKESRELLRKLRSDMDGNLPTMISGSSPRIKNAIANHKAREYAYAAGRTAPNAEDRRLGIEWFDNLTPAEQVEAKGPLEFSALRNAALRTESGDIARNARSVLHHKYELGKGYPHTINQNDFEVIPEERHKAIHADPAYTGRPPLGPQDPGIVRRTILNLFNNPVTRTAAKALPIAGYGMAAKAADDYYSTGHPILGTISAASAVPVLGDVFGIPLAAAELGGIGINALVDEYNRPDRKKRAEEMNLFNMVYSP